MKTTSVLRAVMRRAQECSLQQHFISLSQNYQEGDERCLPYPEISPKGRSLYKMTKLLQQHHWGVVITPQFAEPHTYLMRAQKYPIFSASQAELGACISAQGGSDVFDYWRNDEKFSIDIPTDQISFWINPPPKDLIHYKENVCSAYIGESVDESIIKTLGEIGIQHAQAVQSGFWLTR